MRLIFFMLLFGLFTANAQTYSIKVSQLDSLLWMAQKYRSADSALDRATASIQALRQAISEKSDVATIQGEQLKNYQVLVENLKATISNDRELAMIDQAELKQKVRKRGWIIFGETSLIALLVAILLL